MDRFICIHGHFYQPPRENPWLEAVELQDSAYPYHDWNERITAESYRPNATARILDGNNRVWKIANNYSHMSFNVGPTLLAWMQNAAPDTYEDVLEADRVSRDRFSGHGSAMAQVYNHMIMPLSNRRDQYTQVLWGIRDFEHRFGHQPEGMWLPETAVDINTLEILAEQGIRYTVLAPHQAGRIKKIGEDKWQDVGGGQIDPTRAYVQRLPSGRKISLFFYDGPISRGVAFEKLLEKGELFASRLAGAFNDQRTWSQLVHIATDGETYGHHFKHGEMALAYAFEQIERNQIARITNYGEYLEKSPPTHQVEIIEATSWSCAHGVERWRSNCGCSGGVQGWTQEWRAPLRAALDWLRDTLAGKFEERGRQIFKDPWAARDNYIDVVLQRTPETIEEFMSEHGRSNGGSDRLTIALKLMEMQRHAMYMYTSCGWFFDDISGVESSQVIQYAGRAVQLAQELFADGIEREFTNRLATAKSNIPENRDGALVYEKFVKSAMISLPKVGSHYAISSLFEEYGERNKIYSYSVERKDYNIHREGAARLAVGRVVVTSDVTLESKEVAFGALHLGDHNLSGGVLDNPDDKSYRTLADAAKEAFSRADLPEVIRVLDRQLGASTASLRSLFRDEQRKVLGSIMESAMEGVEAEFRGIYDRHAGLMSFLATVNVPVPKDLLVPAERVVNADLRRAIKSDGVDLNTVHGLIEEARSRNVPIDDYGLSYDVDLVLDRLLKEFAADPTKVQLFSRLAALAEIGHIAPLHPTMAQAQDEYWDMLQTLLPDFRARADKGDKEAAAWCEQFVQLGQKLGFGVDQ